MTDARKEYWQNVFVIYDKEAENSIKVSQLEKYLKAVGLVVERKELNLILDEYASENKDKITFEDVWSKFSSKPTIQDDEIIEAFKTFSPSGKINKEEIKYILMSLGDKISEEEVNDFFRYFKGDKDEIDYKEFLERYGINI